MRHVAPMYLIMSNSLILQCLCMLQKVYGHSSNNICGGAMGNYRKSRDRKRPWREVTWSELCSAHARLSPAFFSYYSSRKCNTVVSTSTRATVYHCLPEIALSLVIYPFPAILFSWGAPSIDGHSAFIQACD